MYRFGSTTVHITTWPGCWLGVAITTKWQLEKLIRTQWITDNKTTLDCGHVLFVEELAMANFTYG